MSTSIKSIFALLVSIAVCTPSSSSAEIDFETIKTADGDNIIVVSGTFEWEDSITIFRRIVQQNSITAVSFNSNGGNVAKAMELGREIRSLKLSTLQPRALACASACALSFMGGVNRGAEPGSIGVHKSSFAPGESLDVRTAVSAVQELTAEIVTYMIEMGVDPALLQLSLTTEANDMRYLSGQEMQEFNLTHYNRGQPAKVASPAPVAPKPLQESPSYSTSLARDRARAPVALSGSVRHPKGAVAMKKAPDAKSTEIVTLRNGAPVFILEDQDRWYKVNAGGHTGFMHHTWIRVDQFDATMGNQRLIQIKSFDNLDDALVYVRVVGLPLSVYVATNGWYAVTIEKSFERARAISLTKELRRKGVIPEDSFVTLGNTYVSKVCCG